MKLWPGHVKIIGFLLAHKLISLCMASVNDWWYSHGIIIRVHYFEIWCATFNKMSLNHYGKCLLVFMWLHYCWISLILKSLCAISFECSYWCAQLCLLQTFILLIVHSFSVPSLAIDGEGVRRTPKGTPTVVRRGQTDWVHRLLCGLPGVHRGPRTLLPGTPLIAGQRAPHRAVLPVEWMDVLRPRWDGVLIGVMMLWSRGTTLLIGA